MGVCKHITKIEFPSAIFDIDRVSTYRGTNIFNSLGTPVRNRFIDLLQIGYMFNYTCFMFNVSGTKTVVTDQFLIELNPHYCQYNNYFFMLLL